MDMIVNSLYSNRDVFLRELVSNASDALDKARFTALKEGGPAAGDLRVRIRADEAAGTITIEDSGIGMSRDDLLSSLGTIARSGTAKFAEAAKAAADGDASGLIGQFGVGFYSAFLVADRVSVLSRPAGAPAAHEWSSMAGAHSYTVREVAGGGEGGDALERGTRVTLHLKDDAKEYLSASKLTGLVKQYSEFIAFPIEVWAPDTVYDDVEDAAATAKAQTAADEEAKKQGKDAADPVKPVTVPTPREEWGWRVQNATKPLWTRPPKDVSAEEYAAFYKQTFREFVDPAAHAHFSVEGTLEFTALLYVPGMPPFEAADWLKPARNIRLFVKRVFISDEFDEALLPRWCSFVKGVVDSADLPLNVSREILQVSLFFEGWDLSARVVRRALSPFFCFFVWIFPPRLQAGKIPTSPRAPHPFPTPLTQTHTNKKRYKQTKNPTGIARCAHDPAATGETHPRHVVRHGRRRRQGTRRQGRQVRRLLGRVRQVPEAGRDRGRGQPESDCAAPALCVLVLFFLFFFVL